jgi:hypothetical protein
VAAVLTTTVLAGCGGGAVDAPLAVQPPVGPPVPYVVGKPLDVAKSSLEVAGFVGDSQDVLRDREQLLDGNWVVCTQAPGPVPAPVATVVELGVVKDVEECPGSTPTTTAAATTTPAPTPRAAPPRPAPAPVPRPQDDPDPEPAAESEDDEDSGGGSSAGTVNPGSFCDPPGTGVSKTGKAMVCAPGSDGRNRWRGA